MPEGSELRYAAAYVARVCQGRVFTRITRSDLATHARKHPVFEVPFARYSITAEARGKEMRLKLASLVANDQQSPLYILVRFGMSGNFVYLPAGSSMPKHAHLRFHDETDGALAFVDPRRFGSWQVSTEWAVGAARSPCIMQEFNQFCLRLRDNLGHRNFDRPICEILLDPAWSNGSGNYIRAEALHRARVHPFSRARDVLKPIFDEPDFEKTVNTVQEKLAEVEAVALERVKPYFTAFDAGQDLAAVQSAEPIPLSPLVKPLGVLGAVLDVALESYHILVKYGFEGDRDHTVWMAWLQAYTKAFNCKDDLGRTMWYDRSTPVVGKAIMPKNGIKSVSPRGAGAPKREPSFLNEGPAVDLRAAAAAAANDDADEEAEAEGSSASKSKAKSKAGRKAVKRKLTLESVPEEPEEEEAKAAKPKAAKPKAKKAKRAVAAADAQPEATPAAAKRSKVKDKAKPEPVEVEQAEQVAKPKAAKRAAKAATNAVSTETQAKRSKKGQKVKAAEQAAEVVVKRGKRVK